MRLAVANAVMGLVLAGAAARGQGAAQLLSCDPPVIPATSGAQYLTLTGANFRSSVQISASNGARFTTTFVSDTMVKVVFPGAEFGGMGTVTFYADQDGLRSNPLTVKVEFQAVLTELEPRSVSTSQRPLVLKAAGTSLVAGMGLCWNGTPLTTTAVDATHLQATVPVGLYGTAGTASVALCAGFFTSNSLPVNVYSGTYLTSVAPRTVVAMSEGFELRMTGTAFPPGTAILWNGRRLTTRASETLLAADIEASMVTRPERIRLQVVSAAGAVLDATDFEILASPLLSEVTPGQLQVSAGETTLVLRGQRFFQPVTVLWNTTELRTIYFGLTELRATVPAALLARAGQATLTVKSGTESSNAATVTVGNGLMLSQVLPAKLPVATEAALLTLSGAGFGRGAVVKWAGQALLTTFVSGNQLTALVPAELLRTLGTVLVTVVSGQETSGAVPVEVVQPPKAVTISGFAPAQTMAGGAAFRLRVRGSGYVSETKVTWNGVNLETQRLSETELEALVPAWLQEQPGRAQVVVLTPAYEMAGPVEYVIAPKVTAAVTIEGESARVKLEAAAPRAMSGTLELEARPYDGTAQFLIGGTTAAVTIAQGATEGVVAGGGRFQKGTAAGERRVALTALTAGGGTYQSAVAPAGALTVESAAPVVAAVRRAGTLLEVDVVTSTKELKTVQVTAETASGTKVLRFDAESAVAAYFLTDEGLWSGGVVRLRMSLPAGVTRAAVVVANSLGESVPVER